MKRILCIWIPNWPIQRLLAAKPEVSDRGVVLHVQQPGRGKYVLACNKLAERLGIRPGMSLSETLSLSGHKRQKFHAEPHDPYADALALSDLAVRCDKFSPLVGIEEADVSQSLLLDVTGVPHLFRGEENLARQVAEAFSAWNYLVRVTVAATVGAAWAAAHFLAANGKPAILLPNQTEALSNLPLEGLRLSPATVDLLHQLGVNRISEVARLPRSGLKARFGEEVLLRLDQLTGRCNEIIVPHRPLPRFKEGWLFENATTSKEVIEHVLFLLLDRLMALLRTRQQAIVELACRFELEGSKPALLKIDLYEATVDPKHLFDLITLQLENQRLAAPVTRIMIEAQETAPLAWRQCELFADRTRGNSQQLAQLTNRLSSRLGRDCVVRPRLGPDAVPERAYFNIPLVGQRKTNASQRRTPFAPFERPLRLLTAPVPIDVIASAPDGPPAVFFYQGSRQDVSHWWGPECIESAWWRGPSIRRDYYRVETTTGHRFWLFRRLQDLSWFLHGEFD
jgi:protein ImuB